MAKQEDADRFKPEGKFKFPIEQFSSFANDPLDNYRLSVPHVFIQGIPWEICIQKRDKALDHLAVYLQCVPENPSDFVWTCEAEFTFKILSQKEEETKNEEDGGRRCCHVFHRDNNGWGFPKFRKFEDLMLPENGWYNEETDTITIEAEIKAKIPRGFKFSLGAQWHRVAKNCVMELFETGQSPICTIECIWMENDERQIKKFFANKNVLAAHSDVFRAMFDNENMKECAEQRVRIADSTPVAIYQMLYYMYTGRLPAEFKPEDAAELLKLGDKYHIEPLAAQCEERMMKIASTENVCAYLQLADQHNAHLLRIVCGQLIRENLETVKKQEEWTVLNKCASQLLVNILEELTKKDFK